MQDTRNNGPSDWRKFYEDKMSPPGTTMGQVMEMRQRNPDIGIYRKDSMFTLISMRNFSVYTVLGSDEYCTYTVDPHHMVGFVFDNADIDIKPAVGMLPVLQVRLRDSGIKGYKQALTLGMRKSWAEKGIATTWYMAYVGHFGGIVTDSERLEGGKPLWHSFIRTAAERGVKISLYDAMTKQAIPVGPDTPQDQIWSKDQSLKHTVIVLERRRLSAQFYLSPV